MKGTSIVKCRGLGNVWEVELFRCLGNNRQFRNGCIGSVPINLQPMIFCPNPCYLLNRLKHRTHPLDGFHIPGPRPGRVFGVPAKEARRRRSGAIDMQHIPDIRIGNTHVHRHKLSKEMNRIKGESFYVSPSNLFRELLQRYPGPPRMHLLGGVADDILSLERCQMRIHSRRRPDGVFLFPERDKVQTGAMDDARGIRKTEKYYLMPARLHLAPQSRHWMQVPGERHAEKTYFHYLELRPKRFITLVRHPRYLGFSIGNFRADVS